MKQFVMIIKVGAKIGGTEMKDEIIKKIEIQQDRLLLRFPDGGFVFIEFEKEQEGE